MKAFLKRLLYWEGFDLFSGWKNVSDFQNLPSRAEENLLRGVKDALKKTYLDYFDIKKCNFLPLLAESALRASPARSGSPGDCKIGTHICA